MLSVFFPFCDSATLGVLCMLPKLYVRRRLFLSLRKCRLLHRSSDLRSEGH